MLYNNKFTVIANWKMNPGTYAQSKKLINSYLEIFSLDQINLIVAVPNIYLGLLANLYQPKSVVFSSQNVSYEEKGAFTGEISATMIKDLGVNYSIIGHSECRKNYKESNKIVAKKLVTAIKYGLTPIVCIGETKDAFKKGELAIKQALIKQLDPIISQTNKIVASSLDLNNLDLFIGYEPVWAIGSQVKVKINYIKKICNFLIKYLRSVISSKIDLYLLYGGSVNSDNISKIKMVPGLAGILVGGASLDPVKFNEICTA